MDQNAPDTLPSDFFDKPAAPAGGGGGGQTASAPDTLPSDFFDKPQPKTLTGFLSNVFSSAGNMAGNIATTAIGAAQKPLRIGYNAVTGNNVVPTESEQQFDNIGDTIAGLTHQGFKKVGLGSAADETPEAQADIAKAEALEDSYKKRYGGWQNVKDTVYNDPVGVLGDVAALTGGVSGTASRASELADAANMSRTANALRTTSKVAKAATVNNPIVSVPTKYVPAGYRAGKVVVGDYIDRVPDPHVAMIQALKPTASRVGWDKSVAMAMPDIKAAEASTGAIKDVDSLLDTVTAAKKANRVEFNKFTGPAKQANVMVDMTPVADAMEASIPETVKFENSINGSPAGAYKQGLDHADLYRRSVPIEQAEKFLRDVNAELDAYYAKYPGVKRAQLRANPETARLVAKADQLRNVIYDALDSPSMGAGPREINRRYGALIDIEDAALRRKNVAARLAPQSLPEQLGNIHSAGHIVRGGVRALAGDPIGAAGEVAQGAAIRGIARWLKEHQNTNNLIRRSFKNYDIPQSPFPQPAPTPFSSAGYLPAATSKIGTSGVIVPDILGDARGRSVYGEPSAWRDAEGRPGRLIDAAPGMASEASPDIPRPIPDGVLDRFRKSVGIGTVRTPSAGVAQPFRFGRSQKIATPGKAGIPISEVSGPGLPVGNKTPFPLPPAGTYKNPYRP